VSQEEKGGGAVLVRSVPFTAIPTHQSFRPEFRFLPLTFFFFELASAAPRSSTTMILYCSRSVFAILCRASRVIPNASDDPFFTFV
jgi:hypothetical protein